VENILNTKPYYIIFCKACQVITLKYIAYFKQHGRKKEKRNNGGTSGQKRTKFNPF
jgi:hypothetical protein